MSDRDDADLTDLPHEERRTDPTVVAGTSSVDLSGAPPPRPAAPKADLLSEAEQLTLSPDEFDDIWQTGVRARSQLLEGLMTREEREAAARAEASGPPPERFEAAESAAGLPRDWQHLEKTPHAAIDPKRLTDPSPEPWTVDDLARRTEEDAPLGIPTDAPVSAETTVTEPGRVVPPDRLEAPGPIARLRFALAAVLRRVAEWVEPNTRDASRDGRSRPKSR